MSAEQPEPKEARLPVSVSAAVLISDEQSRLLLLQQNSQRKGFKWGPPAGGMHANEDPIMTAKREVLEEIGVKVKLIDLVGVYTSPRGINATGLTFVFRGKISSGSIILKEDEIKGYKFFTTQEIQQLIEEKQLYKPEYNIPCVEDWLKGKSYNISVVNPLITIQKLHL